LRRIEVARTKEFEPDRALDSAMDLFWRQGYEATSVHDLLAEMGIGRGSMYDTFGDKRTLFLAALDRFEETRVSRADGILASSASAVEGIRRLFETTIEGLVSYEPRRGCLLANTAVELAPHDEEVAGRISRYVRRTEDAFERALVRGRAAGEVPANKDPKALARFLVSTLHGVRVLARAGVDRTVLDDSVRTALEVLR
jgi:TetR/AcrR family transcriptional regulator, transcriptional repressor for nem operon